MGSGAPCGSSETFGGGAASASQRVGERGRVLRREPPLGSRCERRGPEPEPAVALRREPLDEPGRGLLHPPVLGEAACELLGGLLRLEPVELGGLVGEEPTGLQLEQRRDEDEELAARLEIELVSASLRACSTKGEDDRRDVDLARLEVLLQQERQEEVERALEGVEVELELAHGRRGHARRLAALAGRSPDAEL